MTSLKTTILDKLNSNANFKFKLTYKFPYNYLQITCDDFNLDSFEDNEEFFSKQIGVDIDTIRDLGNKSLVIFEYLHAEEFKIESNSRGSHWIEYLLRDSLKLELNQNESLSSIKTVHFFGFKGGQGRSAVLTAFSKELADNGLRVLVIDSDLEAPSADIIFTCQTERIDQTLLGIYLDSNVNPSPVRGFTSRVSSGVVDVLPAKPSNNEWDIEYSAFILQASLTPSVISSLAEKVREIYSRDNYNIILIDHRSGISATPLFWKKELNGSVVIFTKLDSQWRHSKHFLKLLLEAYPDKNNSSPGVFMSWIPDEENSDQYKERTKKERNDLLKIFLDVWETRANNSKVSDELSDDIADEYWIPWFYSSKYRGDLSPIIDSNNKDSIFELRRLLEVNIDLSEKRKITPSGADSQGLFIQTNFLSNLLEKDNDIAYILGRKGTGKTRIFKEIVFLKYAQPLLVPSDYIPTDEWIRATDDEIEKAVDRFIDKPENFWWCILYTVIINVNSASSFKSVFLKQKFKENIESNIDFKDEIIKIISATKEKLTYTIDGVEEAFEKEHLRNKYIPDLFRFINKIETDLRFVNKLKIKLFLRTDLIPDNVENIEQHMKSSKRVDLAWDEQSILNFLVSLIYQNDWFKNNFSKIIEKIEKKKTEISLGNLSIDECDRFLSKIFPEKMGTGNILMLTFFKTYFSDSEVKNYKNYYPRVFHDFIEYIANANDKPKIEKNRISISLVSKAYEEAAKKYLQSLTIELSNYLKFVDGRDMNSQIVKDFRDSFIGELTPFNTEEIAKNILKKMKAKYKDVEDLQNKIKIALKRMKAIGIFEDRIGYPGEWRTGRLFKTSLQMIYNRKRSD